MARVVFTGPTPPAPAPDLGNALLGIAEAIKAARTRRALNAFANSLAKDFHEQFVNEPTAQARELLDPGVQGAPRAQAIAQADSAVRQAQSALPPVQRAFANMSTKELAEFLLANPELLKDPAKLNRLFLAQDDYEFQTVGNVLVRTSKTTGRAEPVFSARKPTITTDTFTDAEGNRVLSVLEDGQLVRQIDLGKTNTDKFEFKVVGNNLLKLNKATGNLVGSMRIPETGTEFKVVGNALVQIDREDKTVKPVFTTKDNKFDFKVVGNALYRVNQSTGDAEKLFSVDEAVKPQDALAKLNYDLKHGFISLEDFMERRRVLTSQEPRLIGGPGGSIIDQRTGEIFAPGRFNVVDREGNERTVSFSTRAELDEITRQFQSGELVQTSISGREAGSELGAAVRAREAAKRQMKAREALSKETAGLLQFANTLRQVRQSPAGAFGLRGNIAKGLGGLIGQVFPGLGDSLASLLSGGATQDDLTRLRTNARALVQSVIPVATGEASLDRISEAERQIAESTLGIFSTLSDRNQAISALSQLVILKLAGMERLRIEAGLPSDFNLDQAEGVALLGNWLAAAFGLTKEDAEKAIFAIRAVRREVSPLFANE